MLGAASPLILCSYAICGSMICHHDSKYNGSNINGLVFTTKSGGICALLRALLGSIDVFCREMGLLGDGDNERRKPVRRCASLGLLSRLSRRSLGDELWRPWF